MLLIIGVYDYGASPFAVAFVLSDGMDYISIFPPDHEPLFLHRYVLACIESTRGVKRGDRVWQMGFGSGFKCNSAVWRALRSNTAVHSAWADFDVEQMRAHLASLPNHHYQKPKAQ